MAKKVMLLALLSFFFSRVWLSYQKLQKGSVAYDSDIRRESEQLYPSFTLCPTYRLEGNNFEERKVEGLDKMPGDGNSVFSEFIIFKHYVKSNG